MPRIIAAPVNQFVGLFDEPSTKLERPALNRIQSRFFSAWAAWHQDKYDLSGFSSFFAWKIDASAVVFICDMNPPLAQQFADWVNSSGRSAFGSSVFGTRLQIRLYDYNSDKFPGLMGIWTAVAVREVPNA